MTAYSALLSFLLFSPQAHAGWFADFCTRHVIADNPNEPAELIEQLRELYVNDSDFRDSLKDIYIAELAKQKPDEMLLRLIELELNMKGDS